LVDGLIVFHDFGGLFFLEYLPSTRCRAGSLGKHSANLNIKTAKQGGLSFRFSFVIARFMKAEFMVCGVWPVGQESKFLADG
jgi:hypothetical protein